MCIRYMNVVQLWVDMYSCVHHADMEWLIGSGGANEVDIGYCPLLRLTSIRPSVAWQADSEGPLVEQQVNLSSFQWSQEIPLATAQSNIDKRFYPFKEVNAVNVPVRTCAISHSSARPGSLSSFPRCSELCTGSGQVGSSDHVVGSPR